MESNIDVEHFNATIEALADAKALLTLPERTIKAIIKQQGDRSARGIIAMLFIEAWHLCQPGQSRWMDSGDNMESGDWEQSEEAAECMFSELHWLSKLPTGPQRVFDLLFEESWARAVEPEAFWDWSRQLDDLVHHTIIQQYKLKAKSAEAWDPQPWIKKLQRYRDHVKEQYVKDERDGELLRFVLEKSLEELQD